MSASQKTISEMDFKIKTLESKYLLIGHVVKFKIEIKHNNKFVNKLDKNCNLKKEFLSHKLLIKQYK